MKTPNVKQVRGRMRNIPISDGNTRTYKQTNNSNYQSMAAFRFRGSPKDGKLTGISAIVSTNNTNHVMDVRVMRLSDGNTVAEKLGLVFNGASGFNERIESLTLSPANIPTTDDILEVQVRNPTGPGQSRIHEISLEF